MEDKNLPGDKGINSSYVNMTLTKSVDESVAEPLITCFRLHGTNKFFKFHGVLSIIRTLFSGWLNYHVDIAAKNLLK